MIQQLVAAKGVAPSFYSLKTRHPILLDDTAMLHHTQKEKYNENTKYHPKHILTLSKWLTIEIHKW